MDIRRIDGEERFEAYKISAEAFHMRTDDLEKARAESIASTCVDWGAFDDDGTLMARIINNNYTAVFDGAFVPMGGIGAVSTLPQYREKGAIRAIFEKLLPDAREKGEVISSLYPFNHAFYRKVGYETIVYQHRWEMPPEVLKSYRCESARPYRAGSSLAEYMRVFDAFIRRYNCAVTRTEEAMARRLGSKPLENGVFTYLMEDAFVTYKDAGATLEVQDLAWASVKGFNQILGFLARFTADYSKIALILPADIDLTSLIRTPKQYDIAKTSYQNFMARVMNTQKLLELMKKPAGAEFVIEVCGDFMPENNGVWEVSPNGAAPSTKAPDITTDIRALIQLSLGAVSLYEAELRGDTRIFGSREILEQVFVKKPVFISEHF